MKIKEIPVEKITPYARNPRNNSHAVNGIAASIKEFGFQQPIVLDENNVIVAGHTRLLAAQKLDMEKVPCVVASELTPEQVKAYRILDNKLAEKADWDNELLAIELEEIELDLTPFEVDFDLPVEQSAPDTTEDEVPEAPKEAFTQYGDIWRCGNHLVICLDANEFTPEMSSMCEWIITDPPYGIGMDRGFEGFEGFGGFGPPIARRRYEDDWDSEKPTAELFNKILSYAERAIIFGGNFFTDKLPQGNHWIVWNKNNTMPTFGDCELAWTNVGRNSVKKYDVTYNGLIGKEQERHHPTQKPVALFVKIIFDYLGEDERVLDVFGGSGTTMIAAERTHRESVIVEKQPKYIDICCQRFYNETGIVPVRESDGAEFPVAE